MEVNGYGVRNNEGEKFFEFCQSKKMVIANTLFKKEKEKILTYKSEEAETQIDYILLRENQEVKLKDCKVIPGEACLPQHRLICADRVSAEERLQNKKKENKSMEVK